MSLQSSRRIRLLVTAAFAGLGGYAGYRIGSDWLAMMVSYFQSDGKVETPRLLGIPINPTPMGETERSLVFAGFIVAGLLLGFVLERIAFMQSNKARARWESMAWQDKLGVFVGLALGLLFALLVRSIFSTPLWANAVVAIALCYVSVIASESLMEQVRFYFREPAVLSTGEVKPSCRPKLLDTNVIIDGRIADVCRAGFVEGPIYVPKFILEELQQIADSSDSLKRARGRRGLEILNAMRKEMDLQVPEFREDSPSEEVDSRLVLVAREVSGAIITNDYNLNKVAELQGVEVLNVNELANAVKPVVLPGEEMRVLVIKEGKEKEQGIAYLDDGTMVVVEGARRLIGDTLDVSVTSVLQTVQGKMIFGRIKDQIDEDSGSFEQNVNSYTRSGPRRKIR